MAPRKRDAAFSANEREPQRHALLVQNDGGFLMAKKSKATDKKTPRANVIWKGSAPATDPIYTGGWNFLSGKFLNPRSEKKSGKTPGKQKPKKA